MTSRATRIPFRLMITSLSLALVGGLIIVATILLIAYLIAAKAIASQLVFVLIVTVILTITFAGIQILVNAIGALRDHKRFYRA